MNTHDFILGPVDTDSISFCKPDFSPFTEIEQRELIDEINAMMPKLVHYDHDGYFEKAIVLKAKNYILWDGRKLTTKGSALKDNKKEPALKEFIDAIIQCIIDEKYNYEEIYNRYILEALNVKDINRWAAKKTITDKVLNPKRTNEQKVLDAIGDKHVQEGDKVYMFFKSDESLCLVENFDEDYHKDKLIEKVFKTSKVFDNIIEKGTFVNYKLKRNKEALDNLLTTELNA